MAFQKTRVCWSSQMSLRWPVHSLLALSPGDAPEGWPPASQPSRAASVLFPSTDSQEEEEEEEGSLPVCRGAVLPCCPPRALVPASVQVHGEGRGSTCRELFLPFTICYVTKMAFQPQEKWILLHSGCPTVNHCVGAMQAAVWSMLVASSNSRGREWTAGLFPSDALAGMPCATVPPTGGRATGAHGLLPSPSAGSTQLIALQCQAAARGSTVSFLTRNLF